MRQTRTKQRYFTEPPREVIAHLKCTEKVTKEWDCQHGRPPETETVVLLDDFRAEEPSLFQQYSRAEQITYDNSWDYRLWNKCDHCRKEAMVEGPCKIKAVYALPAVVLNHNRSGCADDEFARTVIDPAGSFFELNFNTRAMSLDDMGQYTPKFVGKWDQGLAHQRLIHRDQFVRAAVPTIAQGFSLPRFIGELRDCRGLIDNVWSLLGPNLHRSARAFLGMPIRSVAGSHLAAHFGWFPFVKDLIFLCEQFLFMHDDIVSFIEASNKRKTYHYRHGIDPSTFEGAHLGSWSGVTTLTSDLGQPLHYARDLFESVSFTHEDRAVARNVKYHATLDYMYSLPMANELEHMCQRLILGIAPYHVVNLADIWALLPFSFVLDWFLPIGEWIRRNLVLFEDDLHAKAICFNFCESFSYEYEESRALKEILAVQLAPQWLRSWRDWSFTPDRPRRLLKERGYYRYTDINPFSENSEPELDWTVRNLNGAQLSFAWALGQTRTRAPRRFPRFRSPLLYGL